MRGINSGNMSPSPMATVKALTFIVGFAPALCGLAQSGVGPLTGDCSGESTGTVTVDVKTPDTILMLKCKSDEASNVTPTLSTAEEFKVCTQKDCGDQKLLSEYIDGAKAEEINKGDVTVKITDLPSTEKTFYLRCGKDESSSCTIQVDVAKASSNPGGVTPGSPLSCANGGGAITIKIAEEGSTARFTCGSFTLYPRATDRVFGEDCKKEESLKDIVRSVDDNVYTLTAGKRPPKKKWCYLCANPSVTSSLPGQASDYCLVHVESSSRTQSTLAIALAGMLPSILAMLRIT